MAVIDIAISTLNDGIDRVEKMLLIPDDRVRYVVVHQVDDEKDFLASEQLLNRDDILYTRVNERGLSKSRNQALRFCTAELCWLIDDDVSFNLSAVELIIDNHVLYQLDGYCYQMATEDGEIFKKYFMRTCAIGRLNLNKVSSIELVLNRSSIKRFDIKYDEMFGLGATFPIGEENIFLYDYVKNGAKVKFIPEVIVRHPKETTGSQLSLDLAKNKGAQFVRMYGRFYIVLNLLFSLKKMSVYKAKGIGFFRFLNSMFLGSFNYYSKCK